MRYPCGIFNVDYPQDKAIIRTWQQWVLLIGFLVFLFTFPLFGGTYLVAVALMIGILVIVFHGLNIVLGYAGQISIGHVAFMGLGGYTSALVVSKLGFPFLLGLLAGGLVAAFAGIIVGAPSLRIKGFYLCLSTLAAHFITIYIINNWASLTQGTRGLRVPPASIRGIVFDRPERYYLIVMAVAVVITMLTVNITRSKIGRAFIAIRDNDIAAELMGINIFYYKLLAFGISAFYAGVGGALFAHYVTFISTDHFTMTNAVWYLGITVVGGLGSNLGPIFGALVFSLLQELTAWAAPLLEKVVPLGSANIFGSIGAMVFSLVIILFLIFEPRGLSHWWHRIKARFYEFPFSY
jgi:branched-chain amino acid transport system permease protein